MAVIKRARNWLETHPWLFALILVAVVTIPGFARIENVNGQRADDAVVQCENANERALDSIVLWRFLFAFSRVNGDKPPSPEQAKQLDLILRWIEALYAPRDCHDLGRKYNIPEPPPILGGK